MKTLSKILSTIVLGGVFFNGMGLGACIPGVDPNCEGPIQSTPTSSSNTNGNSDLLKSVYSDANAVGKEGKDVLDSNENIFVRVSKFLLQIAVLAAVSIIIYGGVMYAGSQGDEGKTKKAISIILYAVYGLLLALASLLIVNLIQSGVRTTTELGNT